MKEYVKIFSGFGKLVKFIFALPCLNLTWSIYRIFKSAIKKNTLGVILGIALIFVFPVLSIIDMITIILANKVLWID